MGSIQYLKSISIFLLAENYLTHQMKLITNELGGSRKNTKLFTNPHNKKTAIIPLQTVFYDAIRP